MFFDAKKYLSLILVFSTSTALLCGCFDDSSADRAADYSKEDYPQQLTIDVYDSVSNFKGLQSGWFGDELSERFNVRANIIAPNVDSSGSALMDVRAAAGSIGDLIICSAENNALKELVDKGLILNMEDYLSDKQIMKYEKQIRKANESLDGIYAIPSELSSGEPTDSLSIVEPSYGPYLRWDAYKAAGYPSMDTLEDILDVLVKMKEKVPYSDSGEETYGFSFFADWDGNLMNAAKQPCCFYGYDESGFVLAKADGSDYQSIIDDSSMYMRVLKLYYKAAKLGLVDPDSRTNTYSDVFEKYQDGQILYSPWPFLGQSAYNTSENADQGKGFMMADISDMQIYSYGAYESGNITTVIAVGSDTKDPERMMDIIDWLYSDEGVYCNQASNDSGSAGPVGICWELTDEGPYLTEYGESVFLNSSEELIPGSDKSFREGISRLNFPAVNLKEKDANGYTYAYELWDSELNKDKSMLEKDWTDFMGAASTQEYLEENDKLLVAPGCYYEGEPESMEIKEIRQACKSIIVTCSWDMIFAENDAEFEALKKEMQELCFGLGYEEVLDYDMKGAKALGELRAQYY